MRYYVVSDVHSFYTEMIKALTEKGYFEDKEPHKLIICGDMFDRGSESVAMQKFIMELVEKDEVILIRGNHEELMKASPIYREVYESQNKGGGQDEE